MREIRNLSDIKTAVRNRIHAKPSLPGAPSLALEMTLMEKSRDRLEQELERLEKRKFQINKEINFLSEKIYEAKQKLRKFCEISEKYSINVKEITEQSKDSEDETIELDSDKFKVMNLNY